MVCRQCGGPALVGTQHAPIGGGAQGFGLHVEFTPWKTPFCAAHCAAVVTWQKAPAPKPVQHAPVGGGGGQLARAQPTLGWNVPLRFAH